MEDIADITARTRDSMASMRASMARLAELASTLAQSVSTFRFAQPSSEPWLPVETFSADPLSLGYVGPDAVTAPMPSVVSPALPTGGPATFERFARPADPVTRRLPTPPAGEDSRPLTLTPSLLPGHEDMEIPPPPPGLEG
jgi:hypothetical protein